MYPTLTVGAKRLFQNSMNTLNTLKVMSITFGPWGSRIINWGALGVKSEKTAWPAGVRD
jgi:hypothetical protein